MHFACDIEYVPLVAQLLAVGVVVVLLIVTALTTWDRAFRYASPTSPGMNCPPIVQLTHHPPLTAIASPGPPHR